MFCKYYKLLLLLLKNNSIASCRNDEVPENFFQRHEDFLTFSNPSTFF